jgi:uncharacterized protein YdcH (DUF465 family)
MTGSEQTARRVKAARALAGIDSVEALAERINQRGLGLKVLRQIEQGRRHAEPRELAAIAEACGIAREFFGLDFQPDANDKPATETLRRLENAESQLASIWDSINRLDQRVLRVEQDLHEQQLTETAARTQTQTGTSARNARAPGGPSESS